jgi:diketogulonate reductase-like aldo/keto reductase
LGVNLDPRERILRDDVLAALADLYPKSEAQVPLRWHIQCELGVIPKSNSAQRIDENIDVFDFERSEDDMQTITALNTNFRTGVGLEHRN